MCGIIGVYKHEGNANVEIYEGLLMLQVGGEAVPGAAPAPARRACSVQSRKARAGRPGRPTQSCGVAAKGVQGSPAARRPRRRSLDPPATLPPPARPLASCCSTAARTLPAW